MTVDFVHAGNTPRRVGRAVRHPTATRESGATLRTFDSSTLRQLARTVVPENAKELVAA